MPIFRSYIERNLARFAGVLQESVFAETMASRKGWLQNMDPRVKLCGFLLLLVSSSLSHSITIVVLLYLFSLVLAAGSHAFSLSFVRRVWIFMPFYTALIALPALFLTPGKAWLQVGPLIVTLPGARAASFLVLRVATSVSYMFLLVVTTSWPRLLKALRVLGLPRLFVFLLAMTYRYIYVMLQTANALFLARKSRRVGPEPWQSARQWMGSLLSSLLGKSYQLSNEVYLAMLSRGFRGEPQLLDDFHLRMQDFGWLTLFVTVAAMSTYFGYRSHM